MKFSDEQLMAFISSSELIPVCGEMARELLESRGRLKYAEAIVSYQNELKERLAAAEVVIEQAKDKDNYFGGVISVLIARALDAYDKVVKSE